MLLKGGNMEIITISILTSVIGLGVGAASIVIYYNKKADSALKKADEIIEKAKKDAEKVKRDSILELKEESHKLKLENNKEIKEKKQEIKDLEDRLFQREKNLDKRDEIIQNRDKMLEDRDNALILNQKEIQKAEEDGGGDTDHLISSATADTLYLVLHYPQTAAPISQAIDPDWLNEKKLSCQILKKLIGMYSEGVEFDASRVDEFFDSPREQNAIYKILANPKFLIENPTKYANDCIKTIYKNYIDREIKDTTAKLADASVDAQDKVVLLKKVVDLKKMSLKVPNQIEEK